MYLAPDTEHPPKPELVAQGWERRFMAGAGRAKEATELYAAMGYEVHLEPILASDLSEECQGCTLATNFFVTLYTRKRKPEPEQFS